MVQILLTVIGVIVSVVTEGIAAVAIGIAIGVIAVVIGSILPMILEYATRTSTGSDVPPSVTGSLSSVVLGLSFIDTAKFIPNRAVVDGGLIIAGSVRHEENPS